jgi:hypothetical protein
MNRTLVFLIMTVLLLLNMPWFFSELQKKQILGFPPWALYSLGMMVIFAIVVCYFLGKYWDDLAGDEEE